jgi:hypothetical protein
MGSSASFTVEVAEDEFGLLEEPADGVPDQRFDDVGADTWVVAGRAALVGAPVTGAGVAANGACGVPKFRSTRFTRLLGSTRE